VFDHAVNTREIYRNTQYRTRVLKIRENLFLETKVKKKKLKIPQKQTHYLIRKRRREEELSFFLFSETFPRAPPPPASRILKPQRKRRLLFFCARGTKGRVSEKNLADTHFQLIPFRPPSGFL
jgi:hypothetical protein